MTLLRIEKKKRQSSRSLDGVCTVCNLGALINYYFFFSFDAHEEVETT